VTDELNVFAGAYALDALDDDERKLFQAHLRTCAECAEEVRGMCKTAAELSRLVEVNPPPQLRSEVLSAIKQTRPLAPLVDNVVDLNSRRPARWLWQTLAAACALIAIAVSGWAVSEHRDAQRARTADSSIAQLLQAPDVRASTTAMKQGQGTLIYSRTEQKLVLIGHGLPALPTDQTYQLWMVPAGGKPVSGGLFRTDQAGNVEVPASGNLDAVARMAVSVEPAGGSAQPSPGTVQLLNL
jgi:anti-sigma-K factor RskA